MKKTFKNILSAVVIASVLFGTFAGCGKDEPSPELPVTTETETAVSEAVSEQDATDIDEFIENSAESEIAEQISLNNEAVINDYINQIKQEPFKDGYDRYYLYDIDKDGVYELITDTGSRESNHGYNIYRYKDGQFELIDNIDASHSSLYIPADGDGLILFFTQMGLYTASRYTLSDNGFIHETIASGKLAKDEEYDDYSSIYCKGRAVSSPHSDYTLVSDVINNSYKQI